MEVNLTPDQKALEAEILAAIDEAEAFVARDGRPITPESMRELAEDVNRRGHARLAREEQTLRLDVATSIRRFKSK